MSDLHYIDYHARMVSPVPYSRDRAMSESPKFYPTRLAALIVLKEYVNEIVKESLARLLEIEQEIDDER